MAFGWGGDGYGCGCGFPFFPALVAFLILILLVCGWGLWLCGSWGYGGYGVQE